MLEHVMDGMVETAIITHRESGTRLLLCVTLEHGEEGAPFNVRTTTDEGWSVFGSGGVFYAEAFGDCFSYSVAYVPQRRGLNLPTFLIEAPRAKFDITFRVEAPHPLRPVRALAAKEANRA